MWGGGYNTGYGKGQYIPPYYWEMPYGYEGKYGGGGKAGKGNGKAGRGRSRDRDRDKERDLNKDNNNSRDNRNRSAKPNPKEYFFDKYPAATRGKKVYKCPKEGCFGCCLENASDFHCRICTTMMKPDVADNSRRPSSSGDTDKGSRSKSPASINNNAAKSMYESLMKQGIDEQIVLESLQQAGFKYKPPKPPKPPSSADIVISNGEHIKSIQGEIRQLQNLCSQQEERHINLLTQAEECERKMQELDGDISEKSALQSTSIQHRCRSWYW